MSSGIGISPGCATMNACHSRYVRVIGQRLKLVREERKWSQRELAERAGTKQSQISRIEAGTKPEVSAAELMRICDALGVHVEWVWYERGPKWISDSGSDANTPPVTTERIH